MSERWPGAEHAEAHTAYLSKLAYDNIAINAFSGAAMRRATETFRQQLDLSVAYWRVRHTRSLNRAGSLDFDKRVISVCRQLKAQDYAAAVAVGLSRDHAAPQNSRSPYQERSEELLPVSERGRIEFDCWSTGLADELYIGAATDRAPMRAGLLGASAVDTA